MNCQLDIELGNDWRVVRWSLPRAWFLVDIAGGAALGHRIARQDKIDSQAGITPKTCRAIIPPAEGTLRVFKFPEDVSQPKVE